MMKRIGELNAERIHNLNQIGGLQEENARLNAEVERLNAFTTRTIIPNEELQAQVERLTKAGDAMAWLINCQNDDAYYGFDNEKHASTVAWQAAKEGEPSA